MPSADVDLSRADLLSLGSVCASPGCGTRDFLPFRCSFCRKVYCLEHRTHPGCGPESTRVLVCPICSMAVRIAPSGGGGGGGGGDEGLTEEAAAAAFDAHARSKDCDPSNYDRVHNKARCPAPNCREKLGPSNRYDCKGCGATTCLKHRHAADHGCAARAAANAAAARGGGGGRWGRLGGGGGTRPASDSSLARTVSGRLRALFVSCASPGGGGSGNNDEGGERSRNQPQPQQHHNPRVPPAAAAAAAAARRLAGNSSNSNSNSDTKKPSTGK